MKAIYPFAISLLLSFICNNSFSQCYNAPPFAPTACSGGNGAASDGTTINSGNTYWFAGGPTTFASLTLNSGGTFRVCGTLTVTTFTINGGNLIIESGGSLTIENGGTINLNGSVDIINRGTLTIDASVTMQNADNNLWNIGDGKLTVTGTLNFIASSSKIYIAHDYATGLFDVNSLTIGSQADAGSVCFRSDACIEIASDIANNKANVAEIDNLGNAAIYFQGTVSSNQDFTADTDMLICLDETAPVSGGTRWGSAVVVEDCGSCAEVLPIELVGFSGAYDAVNKRNILKWETALEKDNDFFEILKSDGGLNWQAIGQVPGKLNSTESTAYEFYDTLLYSNENYYKLKQVDVGGKFEYSEVVYIKAESTITTLHLDFIRENTIRVSSNAKLVQLRLIALSGKVVFEKNCLNGNTAEITYGGSGLYFLRVDTGSEIVTKKLFLR